MRGITLGAKQGIRMRLGDPRGPFAASGSIRGDIHDLVDGLPK